MAMGWLYAPMNDPTPTYIQAVLIRLSRLSKKKRSKADMKLGGGQVTMNIREVSLGT